MWYYTGKHDMNIYKIAYHSSNGIKDYISGHNEWKEVVLKALNSKLSQIQRKTTSIYLQCGGSNVILCVLSL